MSTQGQDYRLFDLPEVTRFLFHPRPESGFGSADQRYQELFIPVADNVVIGGRFYACSNDKRAPVLLFFHGNGEIVEDYNDIGQFYQRMNISFLAVDYRGYGSSSGTPSVTAMMQDCSKIFEYVVGFLKENELTGALVVMGRSLGSASALELVTKFPEQIDGLIIESGFAFALPLLQLLGLNLEKLGLKEDPIGNDKKIASFKKPTLIIHAEFDHIIPFSDGEHLYNQSSASVKELLKIPGANHNDILARGLEPYMNKVKKLMEESVKLHFSENTSG